MEIKGIWFLITPIIIYLLYVNMPEIIVLANKLVNLNITFEVVVLFVLLFFMINMLIIMVIVMLVDNINEVKLIDNYLILWVILKFIYKGVLYINKHLTVKI